MKRDNISSLTPQGQLSVEQTFFPFGLKWKPLLWRHVMISVKSFCPKVKSMNSSFIKNMNIFDIFYHFPQFEHNKSEVWKGKNLCPWGVKWFMPLIRTWSRVRTEFWKTYSHWSEISLINLTDFSIRLIMTPSNVPELFLLLNLSS